MNRALRVAILVVAGLVVLWLLFTIVFPWVEQRMEDPTLGTGWVVAQHA